MNIEIALWQIVVNLPESLKTELLHYAEYLREKYPNEKQSHENMQIERGYGSWADKIFMSEDFDEPLEDLAEYM